MAEKYPNRTDLQNAAKKLPVTAAPGQTYGEAGAQRAAQKAVPMGAPQISVTPLDAPSQRPNEPVTAGNPLGAGPGAEALPQIIPTNSQPGSRQDLIDQVRYAYSLSPNPAILQLIAELENTQR